MYCLHKNQNKYFRIWRHSAECDIFQDFLSLPRPTCLKRIPRDEYSGIWHECHQCEGAGLYSQLLAGRAPHPISKGVPYHPAEANYFSHLCPTSCSFGLKLMTRWGEELRLLPLWEACQRLKRSLKNSFHHPTMSLVILRAHHFQCQQCWWNTAFPLWGAGWSLRPTGSPPPWLSRILFLSSVTVQFCRLLGLRVLIRCLRSSEATQLDRTPPSAWHRPYFWCPLPISGIAAWTGRDQTRPETSWP